MKLKIFHSVERFTILKQKNYGLRCECICAGYINSNNGIRVLLTTTKAMSHLSNQNRLDIVFAQRMYAIADVMKSCGGHMGERKLRKCVCFVVHHGSFIFVFILCKQPRVYIQYCQYSFWQFHENFSDSVIVGHQYQEI